MREAHDSEYPRRGEYGDPTRRCQWCGKPIDSIFGRKSYCSSECRAADRYEIFVFFGVSLLIFAVLFTLFPLLGVALIPGFSLLVVGAYCLGPFLLWKAKQGKRIREANEESIEQKILE
ncbi:MAG: hypothetical protein GF309_00875 [Candidatus Lokiarchaeota archaeon]|nr:hypothetical protein [Candidatus Lokiarchaeota archaeon]